MLVQSILKEASNKARYQRLFQRMAESYQQREPFTPEDIDAFWGIPGLLEKTWDMSEGEIMSEVKAYLDQVRFAQQEGA